MNVLAFDRRQGSARDTVRVWDPFIRVFHWSFVAAIVVALVTSLVLPPTFVTLHIVSGTSAFVLIVARLVWGLLGPADARFSTFVRGPREVLEHLRELREGRAPRHLGHNPLGGAMIVALIAAVAALTATGVIVLGGSLKSGPLAFATTFATGEVARAIHQLVAYGLIGLIALHVAGAVFESRRTHENLVTAMVDGRKQRRLGDVASRAIPYHPGLAAAIVVVIVAASSGVTLALAERPALGVPTAPLDPLYADECGGCHAPFHPSLAPAATWSAIMAHLANHFGENAEVDAGEAIKIRDYLLANSAEAFDTRAANRFRRTDPADPLRITATPFWRRMHGWIPDQAFAAKDVGSRSNCSACHKDAASGLFNPSSIILPEDAEL